jgi:hypothetical protein
MHTKPILGAAIASALMALGVSTATARNLSLSNQNIRMTFNSIEFEATGVQDTCRITVEGSFHTRTTIKAPGSLVGYVTRVTLGQCQVGTTVLTSTLPWHVTYQGFAGRLPSITTINARVSGGSFRIGSCLVRAELQFAAERDLVTGALIGIEVPRQIAPIVEGFTCPEEGSVRAVQSGQAYQSATTTRIIVTLI